MADTEHDEPLTARKLTAFIQMPTELYDQMLSTAFQFAIVGTQPTEAERAEMRRAHEARWAEVQADYQATRERCAGQPAALAALDVHHPIDRYGIVCDLAESDELPTDWPCSTYEAIKGTAASD